MNSQDEFDINWRPGPYIGIRLCEFYAIDRDYRVNILRNQAMIWSLEHNEDILVDELAHELRIYVERDSALTLFALTCNPRVFDRYQIYYHKSSNNSNSVDEH